jgi:acyl-CoA synthetase (NDP forming)
MAGGVVAKAIKYLKKRDLANFPTGERAMAVLAHMAEYEEYKAKPGKSIEVKYGEMRLPGKGALRALLEPDAMRWLGENGIPIPQFGCATTADEAVKVCVEVGYPVVMKVVSPDILHKSDSGGVRLNICDDDEVRQSFQSIQQAASGVDFRGVIVYPMIHPTQEVLLGISDDAQFGPVVVFGMGGIYTEVLKDVALRIAPIDCLEAEAMIREVRSFPILEGIRGQPPCDLEALAETLVKVSWLPFQYPEIAEIDLNPIFLFSKGLVVGDVRVIRRESKL